MQRDGWERKTPKMQLIKIRKLVFCVSWLCFVSALCYVTAWSQRATIKWMKPTAAAMTLLVFCHSLLSLRSALWDAGDGSSSCVFFACGEMLWLCWFIWDDGAHGSNKSVAVILLRRSHQINSLGRRWKNNASALNVRGFICFRWEAMCRNVQLVYQAKRIKWTTAKDDLPQWNWLNLC